MLAISTEGVAAHAKHATPARGSLTELSVAKTSHARRINHLARDQADSGELQLIHEFPAGSRRSTATLAAGVLKNESQPLRLKTRTVIALLVASNVLGNFTLSRGLHEVGRLVSFSPWPYIHAFANPLVVLGVLLLIVWLISQLSLLSRVDLSYVLPVTSLGVVCADGADGKVPLA